MMLLFLYRPISAENGDTFALISFKVKLLLCRTAFLGFAEGTKIFTKAIKSVP